MTLPRGSRACSALAFSHDCSFIAAADMTDDYQLHIFSMKAPLVKGKVQLLCSAKMDRNKIQMVMFHPSNPNELISVSTGSVVSWTITKQAQTATLKGKLHPNPAVGNNTRIGFTAVAFSKDNTAYTGASDGCIYRWKGSSLQGKGEKLHDKMVSALNIRPDE